jgi:hypothetical protein
MTHLKMFFLQILLIGFIATYPAFSQALPPEILSRVEAKLQVLNSWSTDPTIVQLVKSYNTTPPTEASGMTNEKWKTLSVLDPIVRSFSKNKLADHLRTKKDETMSEIFVNGASGTKAAFLAKTSSWTHASKDKHELPMTSKTWIGQIEVDESTGQQQVQVGIPVLDGGKAIGSIVIGLSVMKLKG